MGIAENIKKEMDKKGLKPADLVRLSGIPQGRLSQILNGKTKNPTIDTISKVAAALKIPTEGLIVNNYDRTNNTATAIINEHEKYELDQDLMTMIFECFDKYEEENGKISAIDKTRIASSIFRELDGHNTTLNEIERSIRMLIDYNS